jgi:hypothetical protein
VHQPRETDSHGPTDTAQGDALAQQAFNQRALPRRDAPLAGLSDKLAWTRLALMILFPIMQYLRQLRKAARGLNGMNTAYAGKLVENHG